MALAAQQPTSNDYFFTNLAKTESGDDHHLNQPTHGDMSPIPASNEKPSTTYVNSNTSLHTLTEYPTKNDENEMNPSSVQKNERIMPTRSTTTIELAPASSFKKNKRRSLLARSSTTGTIIRSSTINTPKGIVEQDVELSQDFEKELSGRRKTFKRLSTKIDEDKVLMGTRISEGHQNYVLMYNMLTGIRIAVGRVSAKPERPLVDQDFMAAHKLAFDV